MSAKPQAIITDQYCDDIRITHAIVYPERFEPFDVKNDTDNVRLHFGLKGNYSFSHKQINRTFHLVGGHHNLMYSKGFEISIQPHSVEIETFGIQFPKMQFIQFTQHANEELKRFSENVLTGQAVILSEQWGSLNGRIEHIINEINHNGYNDGLNHIFLLSKSLELLVLAADSYASAKNKNEIFIRTKSDKEKINAVRDLINDHLLLLPDLNGIAKATGLNEYKLKRGFKEVFNMTVFEYITTQRLNLAFQYLKDTEKTSAEIAYEIGYKTPQHFNNAFKRQFGITPNLVRINPL